LKQVAKGDLKRSGKKGPKGRGGEIEKGTDEKIKNRKAQDSCQSWEKNPGNLREGGDPNL